MRRLWIADVHANLPAFEAVLRDAETVDEIVYLGDIVGYGPHPSACIDLLEHLQAKAVLGNHDASVLALGRRAAQYSCPVNWDEWTHDQLNDSQLSYLAALPTELEIVSCGAKVKAMHQPPGAPYLHPAMPDYVLAEHLQAVSCAAIFCGHSHRRIDRTIAGRRFVCIPPVGQPRNRDPRAGYAIERDGRLEFGFVRYDIERVVVDVQGIGLKKEFCQRWINFLRTGFDTEWSHEYEHDGVQNQGIPPTS
ncbi:MAG: metallophosphatase family protein [Verrucomicrobia bacterium]|nr:metallophosphatase family protein [Verrucomicrobiota bacterium]MBU1734900.1 metallophosphatase family protein [Verrucomicrobiota bacterium]MBU1857694.1 metallophosphatase family protein [Verrucomicrobiota bacterium]